MGSGLLWMGGRVDAGDGNSIQFSIFILQRISMMMNIPSEENVHVLMIQEKQEKGKLFMFTTPLSSRASTFFI